LPFDSVLAKADSNGITIKLISPVLGQPFLLVAVHLPSKLHYKPEDQTIHASTAVDLIRTVENELGHSRTLVIGDFNMDPYEPGMAAARAFHAVMDRNIARRKKRRVQGKDFPFFYNPMWSRMGDSSGRVPGTIKRAGSTYLEYFWRTFDQVLLGPELLDRVPDSSIEIVSAVASHPLVDGQGRWRAPSDHLPILVSVG
jgi:endonuclease/exonuclease/phosphatase family metal-dependent hydrolase